MLLIPRGDASSHRKYVFATHTTLGIRNASDAFPHRAVRSSRYKYIRNLNPDGVLTNNITEKGQGGWGSWLRRAQTDPVAARRVAAYQRRPAEEFYDLASDPHELHNRIGEPELKPIIAEHRRVLSEWRAQQNDAGMEHPHTGSNLPGVLYIEAIRRLKALW